MIARMQNCSAGSASTGFADPRAGMVDATVEDCLMGAKLLMIALDGADSRLLHRLAESGELPEIADLARQWQIHFPSQ